MSWICRMCNSVISDVSAQKVSGLCPMFTCERIYEPLKKLIHVDDAHAHLIATLWKKHIFTLFSCEGHIAHSEKGDVKSCSTPYVTFVSHSETIVTLINKIISSGYDDLLCAFDSNFAFQGIVKLTPETGIRIDIGPFHDTRFENRPVYLKSPAGKKSAPHKYLGKMRAGTHYNDASIAHIPDYYHFTVRADFDRLPTTEEFYAAKGRMCSLLCELTKVKWKEPF